MADNQPRNPNRPHRQQARHGCSTIAIHSRYGSLSLEAALVLPVILLLLVAFLAMQSAVTAEIKLKGALDRTAAELALLSPLAQVIEPILSEGSLSDSDKKPASGRRAGKSGQIDHP